MIIGKYLEKFKDKKYAEFRIIVGLLFFQHGLQKIFGLLTDRDPVELISFFGLAGMIELIAGAAIALGVFTRFMALLAGIEMGVAFVKAHVLGAGMEAGLPYGLIPIVNGGELALLYFACFVVITVYGAGKWSLERKLMKKEFF